MISPEWLKSENSIEIHKILKFQQISLKSEKHTARAYDFTKKMVKLANSTEIQKIIKFHTSLQKSEKYRAGADGFTKVHKISKFHSN